MIGLEQDGEIVLGVVHAPAMGELLFATKGGGAYDERGKRLEVSRIDRLSAAMVSFGGLEIFRRAGRWASFERLVDSTARQRGYGELLLCLKVQHRTTRDHDFQGGAGREQFLYPGRCSHHLLEIIQNE